MRSTPKPPNLSKEGKKQGLTWEEVIEEAGEIPKGHTKKPFPERAAEAEEWAKELKDAPAGHPRFLLVKPFL